MKFNNTGQQDIFTVRFVFLNVQAETSIEGVRMQSIAYLISNIDVAASLQQRVDDRDVTVLHCQVERSL